jgi:shikimate kinase
MPITLIGYRGTGKSSVAPLLAARLGWKAVDADKEIERSVGRSIREIFETDGEDEFRRHEAGVLAKLLLQPRTVIAAGGGAILDSGTRVLMREAGPVVWLQASVGTILVRIGQDLKSGGTRPALTKKDPAAEVSLLLEQREPLYSETASIVVNTDGRTVEEIVAEILTHLPPLPGGTE